MIYIDNFKLLFYLMSLCKNINLLRDILQDLSFLLSLDLNKKLLMSHIENWYDYFLMFMKFVAINYKVMYKIKPFNDSPLKKIADLSSIEVLPVIVLL